MLIRTLLNPVMAIGKLLQYFVAVKVLKKGVRKKSAPLRIAGLHP
jgi:hypothetical protein